MFLGDKMIEQGKELKFDNVLSLRKKMSQNDMNNEMKKINKLHKETRCTKCTSCHRG